MTLAIDHEAPPLRIDETGTIRVGDSRITLDLVVGAYLSGETPETIADNYATVTLAEVYATLAYYLRHRDEIDPYLEDRRRRASELRRHIESQPGHKELRER